MPIDPKLRERLARIGTFEASIETPERDAVRILKAAGWPTDGTLPPSADKSSPEWHAANVLWRIGRVRDWIKRVDRREEGATADWLAVEAMSLAHAVWHARYEIGLKPDIILGDSVRRGGLKGARKENPGDMGAKVEERIATWQKFRDAGMKKVEADEAAALRLGVSGRSIREARAKLK